MHQQLAQLFHHPGREILRSGRGASVQQNQIMFLGRLLHLLADQRKIIADDGPAPRLPAPGLHLPGQHQRVIFNDIADLHRLANRHQLAACWQDRHARAARHL